MYKNMCNKMLNRLQVCSCSRVIACFWKVVTISTWTACRQWNWFGFTASDTGSHTDTHTTNCTCTWPTIVSRTTCSFKSNKTIYIGIHLLDSFHSYREPFFCFIFTFEHVVVIYIATFSWAKISIEVFLVING